MSSTTVLEAQGLVLPWGVHCPLDCSIGAGDCVGLVGCNGIGKTVLARVLAGIVKPQQGRVHATGPVGVLAQRFVCEAEARVVDVLGVGDRWEALQRVYAGNEKPGDLELVGDDWDLGARVEAVLAEVGLVGVDPSQLAETLSGGQQTRLGLAALLMQEPACIILDEPTNNLDRAGRLALLDWLKRTQVSVLVVSHDRELLNGVDAVLELSSLGLRRYGGNYDAYAEQKALETAAAEAAYEDAEAAHKRVKQDRQKRAEAWATKQRSGKGKAAKRGIDKMTRYAARERGENTKGRLRATSERQEAAAAQRKEEALARLGEHPGEARMAVESCGLRQGERVLELKGVHFGFGDSVLFEDFSFRMEGAERVALVGDNGSGKTTLLRLILEELKPDEGDIVISAHPVAYLDQRVAFLDPAVTALEAVQAVNPDLSVNACYAGLARFLFKNKEALRTVGTLSGGERIRLGLACLLLAKTVPKLIILDEPTNHLDLASIQSMERVLLDYDGALLVVSHEEAFLEAIGVERRIVLQGKGGD